MQIVSLQTDHRAAGLFDLKDDMIAQIEAVDDGGNEAQSEDSSTPVTATFKKLDSVKEEALAPMGYHDITAD